MKNSEIYELIMELGTLINNKHQWSQELRKKFEKVTSYLSSH